MNLKKNKENIITKYKSKSFLIRIMYLLVGIFIVSIAYNVFIAPNKLVPKGVGGIAVLLNSTLGWNNSTIIFALNGILLLASLIFLGKDKTKATLLGSLIYPVFIRATEDINVWLQIDSSQVLLSALFGGVIYGLGTGLIFKAGFTTGGTDIINQIVSKYAKVTIGKSMLVTDGLIVLASGLILGINNMMYSILILYITSLISDRVILGISDSKAFLIITDKEDEVKDFIMNTLNHGVTVYEAKGGYNTEKEKVLMTVLPTKEYYKLKEGIEKIDKDVFYIITDTYEVFGGE